MRLAPEYSRLIEDAGLETEAQILLQADPQVRLALRRGQKVIHAHLAVVGRTGADLDRRLETQLRVTRVARALRREAGPHPPHDPRADQRALRSSDRSAGLGFGCRDRLIDRELRLTAIAARRDRAVGHEAEAHAAL